MAAAGEAVELAAGSLGVAKAGGSKRGAVLALLGSLLGGVVGLFVGLPIPIVGPLLAGVAMALRARRPEVRIGLADPMGAALYHYYAHGSLKAEGSSISEGIGQGRITANLEGLEVVILGDIKHSLLRIAELATPHTGHALRTLVKQGHLSLRRSTTRK